jgi:hypothetical protein
MKRKPHSRTKRTTTKLVLRLPDLEHVKSRSIENNLQIVNIDSAAQVGLRANRNSTECFVSFLFTDQSSKT